MLRRSPRLACSQNAGRFSKSFPASLAASTLGTTRLVNLDGEDLTDSTKGEDVVIEEDGRGFVYVDGLSIYIDSARAKLRHLRIEAELHLSRFRPFAFTFGVYKSGV